MPSQLFDDVFIPEEPTFTPNTAGWREEKSALEGALVSVPIGSDPAEIVKKAVALAASEQTSSAWRRYTIADFQRGYASGATTPSRVAERVIAAVEAGLAQSPPLVFFYHFDAGRLRAAAAASTERWAQKQPLSALDGVPFGVKDLENVAGMPSSGGTAFLADFLTPGEGAAATNPCAAALLAAGALLLGKLATHEIGVGTTGLNTVKGTPRNPYNPAHHTGGSSSGTGAAVSAGLCPFGVGSDGGGSIRIPASLCGVVGLKPTHKRLDDSQGVPVDATVAVIGPLANSVADCAAAYAVMAAGAQVGAETLETSDTVLPVPRPRPALVNLPDLSLSEDFVRGKRAGVYWKWFEHATPEVVAACRAALALLEAAGAATTSVTIPELHSLTLAHGVTITSEMRSYMAASLADDALRPQLNAETRATLGFSKNFTGAYYVSAQRVRTRAETHFRRAFAGCDVLVTPATPCTAPAVRAQAAVGGETDLVTTTALLRFCVQANFLGFPAVSVPVGVDAQGLPIGLQLMAAPWHEATLLHCAAVLERALSAPMPKPAIWFDLLGDQAGDA